MKKIILTACLVLLTAAVAADEPLQYFSTDVGRSRDQQIRQFGEFDLYRIGVQRDFAKPLLQGEKVSLSGYFEASLNHWRGDRDDMIAVAFSPVFVVFFGGGKYRPYVEGSIGAALLSETEMEGRILSSHYQFENRLGIGLRSRNFDIHLRYMHYSNGGLDTPNNGVDSAVFGVAFNF